MSLHRQLSITGIAMIFLMTLTGCNTTTQSANVGNQSSPPINQATLSATENNVTAQTASLDSTTHPPTSPYPSFGLGAVGLQVVTLNERLAELGYLPVKIEGSSQPIIKLANVNTPPSVSFRWRYGDIPSSLASLWSANQYTEMTRAAVIAVEHVNHLPIDGIVGETVWKAILGKDAVKNPNPYTYVLVSKDPGPEELRVWQNGKWIYQSICNTGIPSTPTTDGTFAVYQRYISQTMTGTNPDGTKYVDPGVPYVNYFDGSQAIHGFPRASYGFPQSLGCVELPISKAKVVWSLLHYGTLVTLAGHYPYSTISANNPSKTTAISTSSTASSTGNSGKTTSNSTTTTPSRSASNPTNNSTSSGSSNPGTNSTGNSIGNSAANSVTNSTGNSTGNSTNSTLGNSVSNSTDDTTSSSTKQ